MEQRKEKLLQIIIKEHIKTAAPVGSELVVEKYNLGISPATVRNEMSDLEDEGYIAQPYTSAGRIPTEKAYNFFVDNLIEKKLSPVEIKQLQTAMSDQTEAGIKQTAKVLAHFSNNAVFWAFHRHNLYYTGISNLLSQPEFAQSNLIMDISEVIDRVDEIIDNIFDQLPQEIQIMLGSNNPFGNFCSTILTKYQLGEHTGLFGILGPMRMNYEKNLALVKFINNQLVRH